MSLGHSETFLAFLILIITLTVVSTALHAIRVPTIVGFIVGGVCIGPSGFGWIQSIPTIHVITELGIIFLMFALGLEISLQHVRKLGPLLLTLGLPQVALTMGLGALVLMLLEGMGWGRALSLGALLALSSTAVVLKLMTDHRDLETVFGRTSTVVLIFQDLAALPLMVLVPLFAANSPAALDLADATGILKTLAFLGVCGIFGLYVVPRVFHEVVKTESREIFFFFVIALVLGTAYMAEISGLTLSLGAFVAGVLLSESPYNKQVMAELTPLRDNFLGLFFASVGMLLDLSFLRESWRLLLVLIPILFAVKFAVVYLLVRANRFPHGVAISSALTLSQVGEFSFVLAAVAQAAGVISASDFQAFLAVAILSLLFTPVLYLLARHASGHRDFRQMAGLLSGFKTAETEVAAERGDRPASSAQRHVLVVGLGHAGQNLLKALSESGIQCSAVDASAKTVQAMKAQGFAVTYGDATRPEVLAAAGLEKVDLAVLTLTGAHVTATVLAMIHAARPGLATLVRAQFIREAESLPLRELDRLVVAELETAKSLARKVLEHYQIDPHRVLQSLS